METLEFKQTKLSPAVADDCFMISGGKICKNILSPVNKPWADENLGKSGEKILVKNGVKLELHYDVDLEDGMVHLQHWLPKDYKWQDVYLDVVPTPLGERAYLVCNCGKRGNLYLRPGCPYWACRTCLNINSYAVKKFDKRTVTGFLGHALNRHLAIRNKEKEIKRVVYANKLTRKARGLIHLIKKGLLPPAT